MKYLLLLFLCCACNSDLYVAGECNRCRAEGTRSAEIVCFQTKCDEQCRPTPGVINTTSPDIKAWKCGCTLPEKAP